MAIEEQVVDPRVGHTIRYYKEGWRCGHLVEVVDEAIAVITPIGSKSGAKPRDIRIPIEDIDVVVADVKLQPTH